MVIVYISKPMQLIRALSLDISCSEIVYYSATDISSLRLLNFDGKSLLDYITLFVRSDREFVDEFSNANIKVLLTDSDIRVEERFRDLRIEEIHLIDEGIGSYTNLPTIPLSLSSVREFIRQLGLGLTTRRGHGHNTTTYYLERPDLYSYYGRSTLILKYINVDWEKVHHSVDIIDEYNEEESCALLLATWNTTRIPDVFMNVNSKYRFVKAHPHTAFLLDSLSTIDANIPAEIVIYELLQKFKRVEVYSWYSSSVIPFSRNDRVSAHQLEIPWEIARYRIKKLWKAM